MCQEHLLKARRFSCRINVPYLEFATNRADKQMVGIDLIQIGWILLVVNLVSNSLASRLDIDINNEYLLVFETRDGQNRGRCLKECLGVQLNHSVACAGLGTSHEEWSNRGLWLKLLRLLILIIIFGGSLLLNRLIFIIFVALGLDFFDDDNRLLFLRLWLKVGELIGITIEVEELGDAIRLAKGGVDVYMSIAAPGRKVLVLQFAK